MQDTAWTLCHFLCHSVVSAYANLTPLVARVLPWPPCHRCKMTPKITNAMRSIEHFGSRAAGNGTQILSLCDICCRNLVSVPIWVHNKSMSRAPPVGAPRRGQQRAPGSGQAATSVQQKHYREPLIAFAVGGKTNQGLDLTQKCVKRLFSLSPGLDRAMARPSRTRV
jgi:hypothetical protein